MITVVMHKWKPLYTAEHVNRLASSFSRNCQVPHRFVCVTDDPKDIDSSIEIRKIDPKISYVTHSRRPNSYRRLKLFSEEAKELYGDTLLQIDLDTVIIDDITEIVSRTEDFVIVRGRKRQTPYNGSMWLLRTGTRTKVWDTFSPKQSPMITKREGRVGSDQAWIAHALGSKEATWGQEYGIFGYGIDILRRFKGVLPRNAKIVFFWGNHDPKKLVNKHDWVKKNWR